jgi:hypothetical protein
MPASPIVPPECSISRTGQGFRSRAGCELLLIAGKKRLNSAEIAPFFCAAGTFAPSPHFLTQAFSRGR